MYYILQKATLHDIPRIWEILQQAIVRRKQEGSLQWQDGYPNEVVIKNDIEKTAGYVLTTDKIIVGYCAVLFNDEPAYENIEGKWLTNGNFIVVHRVAIAGQYLGKGLALRMFKLIEDIALTNNIYSIKADTNFDNKAMLHIFEKSGYLYCGDVYLRGNVRKAYEKKLLKE